MSEQRLDPKKSGLDAKIPLSPANTDQPDVPPETPPSDPHMDRALADTFPASDPVSIVTDQRCEDEADRAPQK